VTTATLPTRAAVPVTRPYLPSRARYDRYLSRAWDARRLTNDGPLVRELTERLEDYLGADNLLLVSSGTVGLQIALRTLGVTGSVVTTPFTFVATASAARSLGLDVRFADVDGATWNMATSETPSALKVDAVLPVHVFGCPATGWAVPPSIYDAAHAFGVRVHGESVLEYGDASVLSFHATKLFHTVEGGAVRFSSRAHFEAAREAINFGYRSGEIRRLGINAKMSEVHAAMGLAVLDEIGLVLEARGAVADEYRERLAGVVAFQAWHPASEYVPSYFPVLFADQATRDRAHGSLAADGIEGRRYFWPALSDHPVYRTGDRCPVATDVASRVLCLPLYAGLGTDDVRRVCEHVERAVA
jgi:dTDP-4-amino-4,6-dideoxygalactose transaminase